MTMVQANSIPLNVQQEILLPWVESREDRFFKRLAWFMLLLFLAGGITLNLLTLPEIIQQTLEDVSPRLAKLIVEKKKVTPPPPKPEKLIKKKVEKKKPVKEKAKPKKEKKPEPVVKKPSKVEAIEKAKSSGLVALSDELAEIRDSFDLEELTDEPLQSSGGEVAIITLPASKKILTAKASQGSGGISTSQPAKIGKVAKLSKRKKSVVKSKIGGGKKKTGKKTSQGSGLNSRSPDEIERVFQKNKGGIFNIYNRALRKDPTLQGKILLELTIRPDGTVKQVKILSSELNDKKLERKLILKIKRLKFAARNVAEVTVSYPIIFLPS